MVENQLPPREPKPLPEPNPVTRKAYRRQSFWQITFPFLLALLILLALVVGTIWAAAGGVGELTRWMDISVIWLLSPQLFFALISLAFLCVMVFLLAKIIAVLPRYTRLVQDYILLTQQVVRSYSDKVAEPVLKIRSLKASADMLRHQITSLPKGWKENGK